MPNAENLRLKALIAKAGMSNKGLARRIIAMAAARGIAGVRCGRTSVGAAGANRFAAWHREHARDVKAEDARLLLSTPFEN